MKKVRDSNFELLRIVAMIMIIGCHFVTYTQWHFPPGYSGETKLALQMLRLGGKTGVILFVLITGYFNVKSTFKILNLQFKCNTKLNKS